MTVFDSIAALIAAAEEEKQPLWKIVQEHDAAMQGITAEESWHSMSLRLDAMMEADASYDGAQRSASGLSGGDGQRMAEYAGSGMGITGGFIGEVIAGALRMGECNACMKRILAAPTAGACGVMPAVLLPYARRFHTERDRLVQAMYVAAGIGAVIANRASISGAEGGCQAEIGSAAAMTAAALVYLHGGSSQQMADAAAMTVKNMLGLVCDPVAGLVEVPCVKRNVAGAMNAMAAAEMALAGIRSKIPADEVLDAMASVGNALPAALRETAEGGLAATPTGMAIYQSLRGES